MTLEQKIEIILQDLLEEEYFIIDIQFKQRESSAKLVILLDGDQGISIDKCVEVSRKLAKNIEEEDLIETAFVLEVSSAGVDTPLKYQRQYTRNIGRKLKILLLDGSEKTGVLKNVEDLAIEIEEEQKSKKKKIEIEPSLKIFFNDIKQTNVLISFGK